MGIALIRTVSYERGTSLQGRHRTPPRTLSVEVIGAIGALMNRVHQPRTLLVRGRNAGVGTAAGADELVEIPYRIV